MDIRNLEQGLAASECFPHNADDSGQIFERYVKKSFLRKSFENVETISLAIDGRERFQLNETGLSINTPEPRFYSAPMARC